MARKKREGGGPGSGDWLNTYADMVTLLLTFFILLYSMSSLDAAKFNMLVSAFASDTSSSANLVIRSERDGDRQADPPKVSGDEEEAGQEVPVDLQDIYLYLSQYVEDQQLSGSIDISQGKNYVFIRFMDDMLFEPNSSIIRPAEREILAFMGDGIRAVQDRTELIQINGHTAAIPGDPDYAVSAWLLSAARANAVLMFLEDNIGIDPMKLQCVGWGKTKPFASNDTEEGRSKNRRVEILISSQNILSSQLDEIYGNAAE